MSSLSRQSIEITTGFIVGLAVSSSLWLLWEYLRPGQALEVLPGSKRSGGITDGVTELIGAHPKVSSNLMSDIRSIGNTPLVRIKSLSNALGVEILVGILHKCSKWY